jgi:DNA topoisomerase-2
MVPSQRKAFAGARKIFRKKKEIKVYQLTGYATLNLHYQHGDASMNQTIIKMAQTFTGSNQIPMLLPISNGFGSRKHGRGDAGSPRYISAGYNSKVMDIMFPICDDDLLERSYEDGQLVEPLYYCPIVPYSILETSTTTSAGWNINVWARDFASVVHKLRQRLINYEIISLSGKVYHNPNMLIVTQDNAEYCIGKYHKISNGYVITELPLKVWSSKFTENLLNLYEDDIDDIIDKTADDENNIIIYTNSQQIGDYVHNACIIKLQQHLNLVKTDGTVGEFDSYDAIFDYWYDYRREIYIQRLKRQRVLKELELIYHINIQKFIQYELSECINIDNKEDEERVLILEEYNIVKINTKLLFNPKKIKTEDLSKYILGYAASYEYIDDIRQREKSKKEIEKRGEKIKQLSRDIINISATNWRDLWLSELDQLEAAVIEGQATKWLFSTKQHTFE